MVQSILSSTSTALSVRHACRSGSHTGPTAGLCSDRVQANLIVLPANYASDFRRLCKRNAVSCPLLGETRDPGDWRCEERLAHDLDVRKDAPGYNVYKDGKLLRHDVPDILAEWREDSVGFFIGCSFSFEGALIDAGLTPQHVVRGCNVPMYRTTYPLLPSGVFQGNMVVSMRPYKLEDVERVREITRPYVETHGEPVAWGYDGAARLGISDILQPEFGDPPIIASDEVPVFWGCGVTPQLVVMSSRVEGVVAAHAPGKMICLDLKVAQTF